jgi:hypothetical protein
VIELQGNHQAQEAFLSRLQSAWARDQIKYPSIWFARDQEYQDKMLRDQVIGQVIDHRAAMAAGKNWDVVPRQKSSPEADLAAAVLKEIIGLIPKFAETRRLLARAFFYGSRYGACKVGRHRLDIGDGRERIWWGVNKIIDQDQFRYRKVIRRGTDMPVRAEWEKRIIAGKNAGKWQTVRKREALKIIGHVYNDAEEGLGYGKGLREALGWPWYAMSHTRQEALGAIERFARGWVVAKVDGARHADTNLPNSTVATAWKKFLKNMQSEHVGVLSKDDTIEIHHASAEGYQIIDTFLDRMANDVRTLVLSANLPTSAAKGGSYALAQVQEGASESLIQFDRELLEDSLTADLIELIWQMNWANLVELGIEKFKPRFAITQEKREDPQQVATIGQTMVGMGAPVAEADFYERVGFKVPEDDEPVIAGLPADPFGAGLAPFDTAGASTPVSPRVPPPAEPAPSTAPAAAPDSVQDTALNGAQVQAAKDIIIDVVNDVMPPGTAVRMLVSMFNLSVDDAKAMVDEAAAFTPAAPPASSENGSLGGGIPRAREPFGEGVPR